MRRSAEYEKQQQQREEEEEAEEDANEVCRRVCRSGSSLSRGSSAVGTPADNNSAARNANNLAGFEAVVGRVSFIIRRNFDSSGRPLTENLAAAPRRQSRSAARARGDNTSAVGQI